MLSKSDAQSLDREQPFQLGTEHRFPLDLTASQAPIWDAYELALRETWDPEDDALWDGFEPGAHSETDRRAGGLVWSHRAWVDFTAIAESEAVLVRVCLEPGISADMKYCLSMRAVERARSTDLAHLLATRLGNYRSSPSTPELAALLDNELVRRALHEYSDIDTYIAAHLIAQARVDFGMWQAAASSASPALASLIGFVVRDKSRMLAVAWQYFADVVPDMTDVQRAAIAEGVSSVLSEEESRGRQVPTQLPEGTDRRELLEAHTAAASAGLGGVLPDDQVAVFESALSEIRQRFAVLGVAIELPQTDPS
ncbi:MAG: hypothetical protein P8J50_16415 [Acidimicrobiales bacterium]|jgi:hypothetical protein|nr:hypothetical protein [bacterium]MDG2028689.1 hypothetical protein [Acidimicrobiales bacterium]